MEGDCSRRPRLGIGELGCTGCGVETRPPAVSHQAAPISGSCIQVSSRQNSEMSHCSHEGPCHGTSVCRFMLTAGQCLLVKPPRLRRPLPKCTGPQSGQITWKVLEEMVYQQESSLSCSSCRGSLSLRCSGFCFCFVIGKISHHWGILES